MARVTISDCKKYVDNNKYKLVALASQRARDISAGSAIMVDRDNDKDTVVALREVAGGLINMDALENSFRASFFRATVADQGISTKEHERRYKQAAHVAEDIAEFEGDVVDELTGEVKEEIEKFTGKISSEDFGEAMVFGADDVDVDD